MLYSKDELYSSILSSAQLLIFVWFMYQASLEMVQ